MSGSPFFASLVLFRFRMKSASSFAPVIGFAAATSSRAGPLGLCFPHAGRERALLGADHIAIDRGRLERRMAQPSLNEMLRHVRLKGFDTETMPQAFRHGGRASDASRRHDLLHMTPGRGAAPAPEAFHRAPTVALRTPQSEMAFKAAQDVGRQWDLTDDAPFAAFESSDTRNAALDIDRSGCEREHLRDTCAAPQQSKAKEPHGGALARRRANEALALDGVDILPMTGEFEKA
jgi:hypothetical protein